ncbi:hypothetical protein D3C87_324220 [compost metagenome]
MEDPKTKEWRESWENTTWQCTKTGKQITITPEMVTMGAFYSFGESYVDLGNEFYSRFGGYPVQVN